VKAFDVPDLVYHEFLREEARSVGLAIGPVGSAPQPPPLAALDKSPQPAVQEVPPTAGVVYLRLRRDLTNGAVGEV
jgi:hypothetical protein